MSGRVGGEEGRREGERKEGERELPQEVVDFPLLGHSGNSRMTIWKRRCRMSFYPV